MYLARFKPKTGAMRGWLIAGLLTCEFYLVQVCTCFWPDMNQVYLALAKNLLLFMLVSVVYTSSPAKWPLW